MTKKKLMISIDVEALPLRAERDPLNCLIWGEYPEGRLGISEMMDIADQHGVKLTMFLDYCEKDIYGEALLDVGGEIHRRGHDLQLHAHLNFLDQSFWSKHNIKPESDLNKVDDVLARGALDFLCFLENFSKTIANTFRILRQGGLALFYLKRQRIMEGTNLPTIAYLCDPLVYGLPENAYLPSMKVGRTWLLDSLSEQGFESQHFEFSSKESAETVKWFVGHKPC